jgi:hypothetical protein
LSASGGFKTLYLTKDYENKGHFRTDENEPKRTQTNPIKPKTNPILGLSGAPKAKTNPNERKAKPIFGPSGAPEAKTNPNEPNLGRKKMLLHLTTRLKEA